MIKTTFVSKNFTGWGCLSVLPEEAKRLGMHKILLLTDPFLKENGTAGQVAALLETAGIESIIHDQVVAEPPLAVGEALIAFTRAQQVNGVIGLGGGSALDMYHAAMQYAPGADCFIAAAAVSDYRIASPVPHKHKKTVHGTLTLELVENPDIVASVAALAEKRPYVVGFAAETEHVLEYARAKRERKNIDLMIANDVSEGVFASDDNRVTLISATGETALPQARKTVLARQILDTLVPLI